MQTIAEQLRCATQRLAAVSDSARLDAELLLAACLQVERSWLLAHGDTVVTAATYKALLQRRVQGEPLAYILGHKDFWTLRLDVSPAVLVPRPETELLVELALSTAVALCEVLDLGTGSGAIALALARERPKWHLTAVDFSETALAIARANAQRLQIANVQFMVSDWFAALSGKEFDLIVSNPPYIDADDPALRQPSLQHEPLRALSPGANGLAALNTIIAQAPDFLMKHGWILLEHGATQGSAVREMLVARGFGQVRSHHDLAGHERVTGGQLL
jgi:release factor glutamine methyltransferase